MKIRHEIFYKYMDIVNRYPFIKGAIKVKNRRLTIKKAGKIIEKDMKKRFSKDYPDIKFNKKYLDVWVAKVSKNDINSKPSEILTHV